VILENKEQQTNKKEKKCVRKVLIYNVLIFHLIHNLFVITYNFPEQSPKKCRTITKEMSCKNTISFITLRVNFILGQFYFFFFFSKNPMTGCSLGMRVHWECDPL
jgi:hypothetical protein